jgi:hypothetical protein
MWMHVGIEPVCFSDPLLSFDQRVFPVSNVRHGQLGHLFLLLSSAVSRLVYSSGEAEIKPRRLKKSNSVYGKRSTWSLKALGLLGTRALTINLPVKNLRSLLDQENLLALPVTHPSTQAESEVALVPPEVLETLLSTLFGHPLVILRIVIQRFQCLLHPNLSSRGYLLIQDWLNVNLGRRASGH